MTADVYRFDLDTTTKNADNAVVRAMRDGVYTMSVTADSVSSPDAIALLKAVYVSIRKHGASHLSATLRPRLASTTPKDRGVVLIVYDRGLKNPYMNYSFHHNSIIVRDSWRLLEQTVQLVFDAVEHRRDELSDLIVHTCASQQNNVRKFLLVMCRGKDTYRRTFYEHGKRVPVHKNTRPQVRTPVDASTEKLEDGYMAAMLEKHGNTVADDRFIRAYGPDRTAEILTEMMGEPIFVREVVMGKDVFYIAENARRRRNE